MLVEFFNFSSLTVLHCFVLLFYVSIAKENIYLTLFTIHFISTFVFDNAIRYYLYSLHYSILATYLLTPLYFGYDIDDFYKIKDRFLNISYQ
jgi:hypothetical protein